MINRNKKILLFFCLLFLISNFSLVMAKDVTFTPQIKIPGQQIDGQDIEPGQEIKVKGRTFIDYMIAIYEWSVTAIAIIAVIMIMIAGFQWMTAAGNASAIGQARSRISSSLIGLLLAVGAYSLLNFVNPSLVHLRPLDIGNIDYVDLNISETRCDGGVKAYAWLNYYNCFDLHDDELDVKNYQAMNDMGIDEVIKESDIRSVEITLGRREDYVSARECDVANNFAAFEKLDGVKKRFSIDSDSECQSDFDNFWSACLCSGGVNKDKDPSVDFLKYIKERQVGIRAEAQFNANNEFTGLKIQGASKDSHASAFFSEVVVDTYLFCLFCCKKGNDASSVHFNGSETCSGEFLIGYTKVNPNECCDKLAGTNCVGLDQWECSGAETFCSKCHWNSVESKCEQP